MAESDTGKSAAVWMVCVEGFDHSHIYSIHTDKKKADEVCRKLGHQFTGAYVTAPCRMGLDLPEPDDGESFWWIGDEPGKYPAIPLSEFRGDDGFEDDVDYGAVLRRDIADGLVVSAVTAEEADRKAASLGIDLGEE